MATTYQIKDVAERTGFSAATLRYYEEIGLLPPTVRTPAGYRQYDDETLDRLAFIARAKQLGCSLDEVADLTLAWQGGRCGPVQDRLRAVVAAKLVTAKQRIVELMTLTSELQRAASALELHRPDGPCDDRCGCVSDTSNNAPPMPRAVSLISKPSVDADAAIACTLEPRSMSSRLDQWNALLGYAEQREQIDGGVRLTFAPATPVDELIRLVAAEQTCCRFFRFAITVDTRGIALEVRAPADALDIVHSLFGVAA
ncbi:MAG: MerR family transcriptional regulator [Ilumatobacteraceae bacterium]